MHFARILLILLIVWVPLSAYTPRRILTSVGMALERWSDTAFPIVWRLNTGRGQNITGSRSLAEVVRPAAQAWSEAPTAQVSFSEGSATTAASIALDQMNLIAFAPPAFASDAAALTVLFSFAQTGTDPSGRKIEFPGQILEADILFNPNVLFSTDNAPPADRIDLQSQVTHELGHLLGLDHSSIASSVMFPTVVQGATHQRTLSADDIIGVSSIYPRNVFWTGRAGVRGVVKLPDTAPVFGANLVIVDASGKPVVSTITDRDGNYHIQGLDAGSYAAYAEPLDAPLGAASFVSLATAFPNTTVSTNFTARFASVSSTPAALTITKVSGDNQTALAGEALPNPLVVQVRDAGNTPVSGVLVNFAVGSGGGAVVPITAVTDSEGKARTTAYMGRAQNQWFTASAGGSVIGFPASKTITIASVGVVDAATNAPLKELVINAGNTISTTKRVLDSTGAVRTDVAVTYQSTNPEVATVDSAGNILGKKAGFSTLVMSGGGAVSTATITVVEVTQGAAALETTGIAENASGQFYLAATADHTIRLASTLSQTPAVYAGSSAAFGFADGNRLSARFKNPSFLAVDGAGNIYVSDSGNHAIRKIVPASDTVETLAGTGVAGSQNGAAASATFNNPQGIALDTAGYLWVADSGNHTIRRIHLGNKTVETVAGLAGATGTSDGSGDQARFNSPIGIAFEPETLTGQLDRFVSGSAPPPLRVIVADTGNGSIRRVQANGAVQTITPVGFAAALLDADKPSVFALTSPVFDSPTGIAVDRFGTIYISEPAKNRVKVILRTGEIVLLAQPNTARLPKGIFVDDLGQVLLAESDHGVQQITYGSPKIDQVTPDPSPGGQITIKGKNFAPDTVSLAEGFPNSQTIVEGVIVSTFATHIEPVITPTNATLTAIGATQQFTGTAQDAFSGQPVSGQTIRWKSDPVGVATIDEVTGLATAVGNGTATITATIQGEGTKTAMLTVAQAISSLAVAPSNPTLTALGATQQLAATAKDSNQHPISGKTFSWTSSTPGIAAVNATGLVTAVANGTATITASVDGISGTTLVTVGQTVTSVAVSPATATSVSFGAQQQFTAVAKDANQNPISGKTFAWTSSGSVATVNSASGLATAVANGTATITATVDGVSGTALLTVAQAVSSIVINPGSPTLTAVGATQQFTAVAKDANGNDVAGKTFTWTSSAENIATVNPTTGLATAVANGSTTITAKVDAISGTTVLTVDQSASPVVSSVTLSPSSATITALGATHQFTAVARNAAGNALSGKTFTWTSSAESVATINTAGMATAVANGTATITASVDGVSGTASLTVAQVVSSVALSPASIVLTALGETKQFTAAATDSRNNLISGKTFGWSSSAPGIATVNAATGLATAVANGTATITATVDGIAGTAILTVGQTVTSVAVSPGTVTLTALGATRQFTAVAKDANGNAISGKTPSWTSSAPNVSSVNSSTGVATSVANGTAIITASVDGVSGTAAVTVAQAVASILVEPANVNVGFLGAVQQYTAVARDANANTIAGKTFTWTSSATNIASVTSTGLATALAYGNATIVAAVDGISGTATFRVIRKLVISNFQFIDTETILATVPASLTGTIGIGVLNRSGAFPWVITPDGLR